MNLSLNATETMSQLLMTILSSSQLHAKWLNTLSFLENCGARKIAACEHPTLVREEVLKHASEEFRHAYYLKRQIERVSSDPMDNYSLPFLLGGMATWHYLPMLDLQTSRYLKGIGATNDFLKEASYLLVTYAIELRAQELYPIYDKILREAGSKVTVRSILLEENEHLEEMKAGLQRMPSGFLHAEKVCAFEKELYKSWLEVVTNEVHSSKE